MTTFSPISRFLLILAAFVVVVAGMREAKELLVPFLLSLFIAVISSPPLHWLKQKGLPNGLAILCIIAVVIVAGSVVGAVFGSSFAGFKSELPFYQSRLGVISASFFSKLNELGLSVDMTQLKASVNPSAALSLAGTTLASFGNLMTSSVLILLTVVFILAEEVGFSDKLRMGNPDCEKTLEAVGRFTKSVIRYMAIKTGLSILTGLIVMLWLWIQGVDYFVLWGMLAFLLNYVPTLGSILAAIPAVLLALIQLGVGDALITAAGFVFVNFAIGNIVEPRMMGKGLDLSALVVFLSLVFWGWVLGPVGMLLSVPLTMTVKIALESIEETRWVGVMLGAGVRAGPGDESEQGVPRLSLKPLSKSADN